MKVIARKKLRFDDIAGVVMSLVLLIIGLLQTKCIESTENIIFLLITIFWVFSFSLAAMVIGVYNLSIYCKTPKEIIKFDGVHLICPDGQFSLQDIYKKEGESIDYKKCIRVMRSRNGPCGVGIYFRGNYHTYRFVDNPKRVRDRLVVLCEQNRI